MTNQISEHRKKIDNLDEEILELIQERVQQSINIRRLKIEHNIPLNTPERERELIQHLIERSEGRIPAEVIKEIWETIIRGGKLTKDK